MSYTIVIRSEAQELIDTVNDLIQKGWKPLGGPGIKALGDLFWYQAMIKE